MYTYNSAYRFFIHKSYIENVHPNTIMDSRNAIFFFKMCFYLSKHKKFIHLRELEISLNGHHYLKDDKVDIRRSKRVKIFKIFNPNFLTYTF
jgi:hypothetical protein